VTFKVEGDEDGAGRGGAAVGAQHAPQGAKPWQWKASITLEVGESVVTLARWLGHSSPAITLGYYAHFMPEAGSRGRTAIDGLSGT
jgi:hypothetical protein